MAWTHSRFGALAALFASPLLASLTAASLTACTSSDSSTAAGDDGGTCGDAGVAGNNDASVSGSDAALTCSPANVQSYSPRWTPPKAHTSSCTAAQIASYAACLTPPSDTTSAACAPWFGAGASANADCHTCLADSTSTDPSWGPVIDNGSVRQINIPGCMALVSGDTGGTGCAGQYQALEGCESAACATNCANAPAQLNACVAEADNGGCNNLLTAAECVNDAGAADQCFGPQNPTFASILTAVAQVFCLSTGDAGVIDAGGGDAGGVTDGAAADGG